MDRRRVLALGGSPPVGSPPAATAPVPAAWDPLVRFATFGWLPGGLSHNLTRTGTDSFELGYEVLGDHPADSPQVHLQAWQPGGALWQQPGAEQPRVREVAPVGGRPARWLAIDASGGGILRWEYAPRAWADLGVAFTPGEPLGTARRIAEAVRLGAAERIRLPRSLRGVPAGLVPLSAQVIHDEPDMWQPWRVELVFAPAGSRQAETTPATVLIARAHKGPQSPNPADGPRPDRTVGGLPAALTEDGHLLSVFRPDDIVHSFYASTGALTLLGAGGTGALAARSDLLGEPPTWTEGPLG